MIEHGFVYSFKRELAQALHDLDTDTLKLALYGESANLTLSGITAYTATGEVSGVGYSAGGLALTKASGFPKMNTDAGPDTDAGQMLLVDFQDLTFEAVIIEPRAALVYNSSKSNRAIAILDFGQTQYVDGDFTITWPTPDINSAIMRMV